MPEQEQLKKTEAQARIFANRLRKRFRHLLKWAKRTGVGAFRLYDRDIPEIPLLLDYYGKAGEFSASSIAGALYKRPYEKDEAEEARWLAAMKTAAAEALGIGVERIFLKRREHQRGASQYEKIAGHRITGEVPEGGLVFKVNLSDYLDTGLFLDRRLMRAAFGEAAAGKRVLNLFCYTASFSVYAAAGGATATDSVDLSNTYLQWAKENFALNGFNATVLRETDFFRNRETVAAQHRQRLIRADALDFLDRAAAGKLHWDLIYLDPPAFSNSKKMKGTFDLRRDHADIISRSLVLLSPNGKLWFSVNQKQFKAAAAELETVLAARTGGVSVTDLGNAMIDEDFRGRKTPLSFVISAPNDSAIPICNPGHF